MSDDDKVDVNTVRDNLLQKLRDDAHLIVVDKSDYEALKTALAEKDAKIAELKALIDALKAEIAKLRAKQHQELSKALDGTDYLSVESMEEK